MSNNLGLINNTDKAKLNNIINIYISYDLDNIEPKQLNIIDSDVAKKIAQLANIDTRYTTVIIHTRKSDLITYHIVINTIHVTGKPLIILYGTISGVDSNIYTIIFSVQPDDHENEINITIKSNEEDTEDIEYNTFNSNDIQLNKNITYVNLNGTSNSKTINIYTKKLYPRTYTVYIMGKPTIGHVTQSINIYRPNGTMYPYSNWYTTNSISDAGNQTYDSNQLTFIELKISVFNESTILVRYDNRDHEGKG